MDFHLRQAACVDVRGKITTKVCRNRERYHLISCHLSGCLENNDLENDDLENDDSDGVARRINGLEGYRGREIRGR